MRTITEEEDEEEKANRGRHCGAQATSLSFFAWLCAIYFSLSLFNGQMMIDRPRPRRAHRYRRRDIVAAAAATALPSTLIYPPKKPISDDNSKERERERKLKDDKANNGSDRKNKRLSVERDYQDHCKPGPGKSSRKLPGQIAAVSVCVCAFIIGERAKPSSI